MTAFALLCGTVSAQFGRSREFRSINTVAYELSVQRNGRLDIALASGVPVFDDAFPMVQLVGERRPTLLDVDGRFSQRYAVRDPLGEGQGMILAEGNCEWSIRTYPTQPFFAIQVSFINDGKKPVQVEQLIPLAIGDPKKGFLTLGPGTDDAVALTDPLSPNPRLINGEIESDHHLALSIPQNNRSLILGFLTRDRAQTRFVARSSSRADEHTFDYFRAECVFDPPIEVAPGERLDSEVLYVGLTETDPLTGLRRLARATAVASGIRTPVPTPLHGVYLTGDRNNAESALETLDTMTETLAPLGFRSLTLGPEWCATPGDWIPDPARYPDGLTPIADRARTLGIRLGIAWTPFQVAANSNTARDQSDWLLPEDASHPAGMRVLNPSAIGVIRHIQTLYRVMNREWGIYYFVGGDFSLLNGMTLSETLGMTRTGVVNELGAAIADGLSNSGLFIPATPDTVHAYRATAASQTIDVPKPSVIESRAARFNTLGPSFYLAPHLAQGPFATIALHGSAQDTLDQRVAWLSGLALANASIQVLDAPGQLNATEQELLRRVMPPLTTSATPVDLFINQPARVWTLPMEADTGPGMLVALFNWDESNSDTITVPLDRIGLQSGEYYTVYDSWERRYHGTVQGNLQLDIAPGAVRVIGLRPYRDRPIFLASGRHFAQGAADMESVGWDPVTKTLFGRRIAADAEPFEVVALVPDTYSVVELEGIERDGRVVTVRFTPSPDTATPWRIRFDTR